MKKIINKIALIGPKNVLLLGLLIVVNILLYIPSLLEPVSYGDECIYLTLGNGLRKGQVFYRDIHDNKPPLLYLAAALTQSLPYFRLLTIIWNITHLIIIYKLISLLAKNKYTPFIGGIIFSLLLLIFEGRIANGEVFMMMPATLAVYLFWKSSKNNNLKNKFKFGSVFGLLFSFGFLFKIPLAFDFVGVLLAIFIFKIERFKYGLNQLKNVFFGLLNNKMLWGMLLGFALPILLSIVYYGSKGAFEPYVRSALMQNIGYLSSWQGSNMGLYMRLGFLGLFNLLIFIFRNKINYKLIFFTTWYAYAMFGALLSARPYPHYLVEIIPSLTIILAFAFDKIDKKKKLNALLLNQFFLLAIFSLALLVFVFKFYNFWYYKQLPYYSNFIKYVTKQIDQQEYFKYFGEKTNNDYKIARFIRGTLGKKDNVYIWGDAACIYALSGQQPPGRYTVNYHIYDFNGFNETLAAIKNSMPRIIVKLPEEKREWEDLNNYLYNNYYLLKLDDIEGEIYIKNSQINNKGGKITF
jgi:hypothetical protein